jgi:hypothetical protein
MTTASELKAQLGLLDESEVCALINMTLPSLRNQRFRMQGPPFTRIGRKVFYPLDKLRAYIAAQTVMPSKPPTLIDGKRKRRSRTEGAAS